MDEYRTGWAMIFTMNKKKGVEQWYLQWNMKVKQWYLQWTWRLNHDIYRIWILNLLLPHTHFNDSPYSILINMTFLWHLSTSGLKKVLPQREHTNLTPKWTFLTWAQMLAHDVDGPSLQPSTWHLYTHLMPPNWILRGCMWAGMASSTAEGAAGETGPVAWPAASETSGPVDSWGGGWEMVALGAKWGFFKGGWDGRGRECNVTPLKSP